MSTFAAALKGQCDHLFSKREGVLSLWQEIAEHVYPERADFTSCRNLGEEMMRNLVTSYPVLARRDLSNAFGSMLRPNTKEWFHTGLAYGETPDTEGKQWLEAATTFQFRAMYDRRAMLARATKEGDSDFAAFGQAVLSAEMNKTGDGLLYRCWHLRDVAWMENENGEIDTIFRRWKPTARDLVRLFPRTVSDKVRKKLEKTPYDEINVRHAILPLDTYKELGGTQNFRTPFVSIYFDVDNNEILEEVGMFNKMYVIPRWQTVSGSQYATSPATVVALADSRLLQDVSRVLLEAGEKAVDPPMLAVKDAIRSDMGLYAGGVTWVDAEYDERLGEVLRPLNQDKSGIAFGLDMVQDLRMQLAEAFYLSKLNLPPTGGPDMTAYEVGQRVQEYIRNALPLFEPLEQDYNGQLCDITFDLLLRASPELRNSIPRSLRGREIVFTFESPLREAIEKTKVGQYMEAQQIIATAIQLDPSTAHLVDGRKATRDVLEAVAPAEWMRTDVEVDERVQEEQQAMAAQQQMAQMAEAAKTAKTLAEAGSIAPAQSGMI